MSVALIASSALLPLACPVMQAWQYWNSVKAPTNLTCAAYFSDNCKQGNASTYYSRATVHNLQFNHGEVLFDPSCLTSSFMLETIVHLSGPNSEVILTNLPQGVSLSRYGINRIWFSSSDGMCVCW